MFYLTHGALRIFFLWYYEMRESKKGEFVDEEKLLIQAFKRLIATFIKLDITSINRWIFEITKGGNRKVWGERKENRKKRKSIYPFGRRIILRDHLRTSKVTFPNLLNLKLPKYASPCAVRLQDDTITSLVRRKYLRLSLSPSCMHFIMKIVCSGDKRSENRWVIQVPCIIQSRVALKLKVEIISSTVSFLCHPFRSNLPRLGAITFQRWERRIGGSYNGWNITHYLKILILQSRESGDMLPREFTSSFGQLFVYVIVNVVIGEKQLSYCREPCVLTPETVMRAISPSLPLSIYTTILSLLSPRD